MGGIRDRDRQGKVEHLPIVVGRNCIVLHITGPVGVFPAGLLNVNFPVVIGGVIAPREHAQHHVRAQHAHRAVHAEAILAIAEAAVVDDLRAQPLAIRIGDFQVQISQRIHPAVIRAVGKIIRPGTIRAAAAGVQRPGVTGELELAHRRIRANHIRLRQGISGNHQTIGPVATWRAVIRRHHHGGDFRCIRIRGNRGDIRAPAAVALDRGQLAGAIGFAVPAARHKNKHRHTVGRWVDIANIAFQIAKRAKRRGVGHHYEGCGRAG